MQATFPKNRLEAFSDGVIAIILTIMVLEMRAPNSPDLADLKPVIPVFLSYVLSFVYVAIYWNNHHHMLHVARRVTGGILWANLHLLFWLSLIPFVTSWMGRNPFAPVPTAFYGVVMLACAIAYLVLQSTIIAVDGPDSILARAIGPDLKGKFSPLLYVTAIGLSFTVPALAAALYVLVALIWLIPDRRIEHTLAESHSGSAPEADRHGL
jgi:uncharacterized membrane protein